jgi:hypothetical protein
VAHRFVETNRGIVGFRLHRVRDVYAGFSHRQEDLVLTGIYQDGTTVKVRIVSYTINGKPASASADAAMTRAFEHPKPETVFQPPFDPRYTGVYSYRAAGPSTIAFASGVRDAAHGNGSFAYDAGHNVVWYTYQPNAMPPHATSGTILDRRSEALPNYWTVTHETQQYRGHYGPFPGTGLQVEDYSAFSRFPSMESALRSL